MAAVTPGLRRSEVHRLDWAEVDLKGGFVEVTAKKSKTRSRRLVPVTKNLQDWLEPHAQKSGKVLGMELDKYEVLRNKAAKAAGFEWRKNALRHSFISYRVAQIQDVARVSLEAGNSPQIIFANYRGSEFRRAMR